MRNLLPLLMLLSLTACGGGGGSTPPGNNNNGNNSNNGTVTMPPSTGSNTGLSVSFSTSSLNFTYNEGEQPLAQVMSATASGTTDKDVLMGAEVNGPGIATPINVVVNAVARTAQITVVPQRGLAPGSYTGTIKMYACADQACNVQHNGSPHTVSYSVTVRPGLRPSASSLNLAAAETGTSGINVISFTPPSAGATVTSSVNYQNGQSGWLTAQVVDNTVRVQASAASLRAGTYQASVVLSASLTGQVYTIPVTLTVGNGLTVSESGAVKIDSATTLQQLQGSISVALAPGANAKTWSASSDQPWLKLNQRSGDFSTQPGWTLDSAAFSSMPNNTHYIARVQISTDGNLGTKTYTLDVHKALAEIKGLDTLALLAGQSGDVLIYGSGFSTLRGGLSNVAMSGVTPTAMTVLSDKAMRLSLPAMQAGSYAITLKSASNIATGSKSLQVTSADTYTYQALDTEGAKVTLIWDAVSKSVFVVNSTLKSVMRYAPVNGRFQLVTTRSFPSVDSIGMTADRSALVLQSATSTVLKLSPVNLSTQATFTLSQNGGSPMYLNEPLTIMGDNRLMHPYYGWIDLDTGAATALTYDSNGYYGGGPALWGIVSGDGMRMIRPDSGLYSPSGPMFHTDLVANKFATYQSVSGMSSFFYRSAVNHNGSVWVLEGQVVDFDLNLRGYARLPSDWFGNQWVFSRDGTRLYHYAQNAGMPQGKPRIYVFDTSKALTTTVNLPILGYIEFDDLPNCPYDQNKGDYEGCHTFQTRMSISDDDKAIFVAGDRKFVVIPVPAAVGPAAANRQARQALGGQTVIPAAKH